MTKKRGRDRVRVTSADFVCEPTRTMELLAHIKNNEDLSWRQLAEEYLPDYSHAYVRKLTLGIAQSDEVDLRLGVIDKIPPEPIPVQPCPDCGEAHVTDFCTHERGEPRPYQPKPTSTRRHRSHLEHGRGPAGAERKRRTMQRIEALGYGSVTEFVDAALDMMEEG